MKENTLYLLRHEDDLAQQPQTGRSFGVLPFLLGAAGGAALSEERVLARHDDYPAEKINLLLGIDWLLRQDIDVLNISMGPLSGVFDENDPLQIATRVAAVDRRIPVVVAAGNRGPKEGTLQVLAQAPWVIAVGAANEEKRLLNSSSRGRPGGPQPTVVALGATEHIDDVDDFEPGTSFAAPKVSHLAAIVLRTLQVLYYDVLDIQEGKWESMSRPIRRLRVGIPDSGVRAEKITASPDNYYLGKDFIRISRGEGQYKWYARVLAAICKCGISQLAFTPSTVKQVLSLMASPLPGYAPHEIGAGFVSGAEVLSFFQSLYPSRFARIFCPQGLAEHSAEFRRLDEELGVLWDEPKVSVLADAFGGGIQMYVARVK